MATTKDGAKLATLKLSQVKESKTNPRRTFSPDAMKELIASVREKGILVPPLVRSVGGSFEIVAGARRFRAAKAAKLKEIPVIVCSMSDVEALEAQVIENLQRQDVHPVEEAEGFRRLMKAAKRTVEDVAEKTGKSISYVYQRLKLVDLTTAAAKAFQDGTLTAGHAILIARLSEKDQVRAVNACMATNGWGATLQKYTISVRDLGAWIAREVHLKISTAPWKLGDDSLRKVAGPCSACPKLAGNSPHLHPDLAKDTCTDRSCFDRKVSLFLSNVKASISKKGKPVLISRDYTHHKEILGRHAWNPIKRKSKVCPSMRKGVMADTKGQGKIVDVCTNMGCKIKGHGGIAAYGSHDGGSSSPSKAEVLEREKNADKARATDISRLEVLRQIIGKADKVGRAQLELIAVGSEGMPYFPGKTPSWIPEEPKGLMHRNAKPSDFDKLNNRELVHYVLIAALASELDVGEAANLMAAAVLYKVDAGKIYRDAAVKVSHQRAHKNQVQRWKGRVASKKRSFDVPTCVTCGCVDAAACPGGCSWTKLNKKSNAGKCSSCTEAKL